MKTNIKVLMDGSIKNVTERLDVRDALSLVDNPDASAQDLVKASNVFLDISNEAVVNSKKLLEAAKALLPTVDLAFKYDNNGCLMMSQLGELLMYDVNTSDLYYVKPDKFKVVVNSRGLCKFLREFYVNAVDEQAKVVAPDSIYQDLSDGHDKYFACRFEIKKEALLSAYLNNTLPDKFKPFVYNVDSFLIGDFSEEDIRKVDAPETLF